MYDFVCDRLSQCGDGSDESTEACFNKIGINLLYTILLSIMVIFVPNQLYTPVNFLKLIWCWRCIIV